MTLEELIFIRDKATKAMAEYIVAFCSFEELKPSILYEFKSYVQCRKNGYSITHSTLTAIIQPAIDNDIKLCKEYYE